MANAFLGYFSTLQCEQGINSRSTIDFLEQFAVIAEVSY
jgi:hypothetical protein